MWHFTKEAASLHGIPDIIGVYHGKFFALEVKRDLAETKKKTGRIGLQRYYIRLIVQCGGFADFICPETHDDVLDRLDKFAHPSS